MALKQGVSGPRGVKVSRTAGFLINATNRYTRGSSDLPVKTLLVSDEMMYSQGRRTAIEDVITTLVIDGVFAADSRMPIVALMAGSIRSRL